MSKVEFLTVWASQIVFMLSPVVSVSLTQMVLQSYNKGSTHHQLYFLFIVLVKFLLYILPCLLGLLSILTLNRLSFLKRL